MLLPRCELAEMAKTVRSAGRIRRSGRIAEPVEALPRNVRARCGLGSTARAHEVDDLAVTRLLFGAADQYQFPPGVALEA
jgi:hypothetical protein